METQITAAMSYILPDAVGSWQGLGLERIDGKQDGLLIDPWLNAEYQAGVYRIIHNR